jgi:hypothetical protein
MVIATVLALGVKLFGIWSLSRSIVLEPVRGPARLA